MEEAYYDQWGNRYVLDEHGNKLPPSKSEQIRDNSGFTHYETSGGHCGLCGSLTCNGGCFK